MTKNEKKMILCKHVFLLQDIESENAVYICRHCGRMLSFEDGRGMIVVKEGGN